MFFFVFLPALQQQHYAVDHQTSMLEHADVKTTDKSDLITYFLQHRPSWYSQNSDAEHRQFAQMHWQNAIPAELCPAHLAKQSQ